VSRLEVLVAIKINTFDKHLEAILHLETSKLGTFDNPHNRDKI
jgi:hypothetical protein